jgi:hypothetical protein
MSPGAVGMLLSAAALTMSALQATHARAVDVTYGGRAPSSAVQRFLSVAESRPAEYRALRHLDAHNEHFNSRAWMDVWTTAERSGAFRYEVIAEGGSLYIRTHVFAATLDAERTWWETAGVHDRAALTVENYVFDERGQRDGLMWLGVKPRRKDVLLVDGSLFLSPDGDLVRVEGRLSKSPSVWTRHVDIVRSYSRIAGVRVPVSVESIATLLVAGRSTFRMTYEYESLNGQRVGTPVPRTSATLH